MLLMTVWCWVMLLLLLPRLRKGRSWREGPSLHVKSGHWNLSQKKMPNTHIHLFQPYQHIWFFHLSTFQHPGTTSFLLSGSSLFPSSASFRHSLPSLPSSLSFLLLLPSLSSSRSSCRRLEAGWRWRESFRSDPFVTSRILEFKGRKTRPRTWIDKRARGRTQKANIRHGNKT